MYSQRQNKIARLLDEEYIDGLILNAGPSLTYFSGLHLHLMERPVLLFLLSGRKPLIVLPELESAKLGGMEFDIDSFTYPDDPVYWAASFAAAADQLDLSGCRIGYEPRQLRLLEYQFLKDAAPDTFFRPIDQAIGRCRAVKDTREIELMKKAVTIAQDSLAATIPLIKTGSTEKEVAAELLVQLLRHGSELPLPFSPIVSTGPNGANPHAKPSEARLQTGDLLVIDWGATWHGYASDLTRTFGIGEIDEETRHIYTTVQKANAAGRAAARPGARCADIDQAARSVIEAAGYGPYFIHRTGHGIGLECHEEPYVHGSNSQILEPGMSFTVEPGIYLPGKNGVRIEDDVLITEESMVSLSDFPRNLTMIDRF